jgi:AcrR family transcriptional regulator
MTGRQTITRQGSRGVQTSDESVLVVDSCKGRVGDLVRSGHIVGARSQSVLGAAVKGSSVPSTEPVRRPRERKAMIVAAAAELFAAHGFAAVGIDDIGERVGVTGPAIYRHFKGKDALLDAVLADAVAGFAVSESAVGEGLDRVVGVLVAAALDRPTWLATYVRERPRLPPDRRRALRQAEQQQFVQLRRVLRADNPSLDDRRITARQFAVLAALSAVALRPATMSRPQLDRVLIDAMVAVLAAPDDGPQVPAPSPPLWQQPVSRRDEIRSAALALFRTRGFHGVGVDEIGAAAGISGPTVYFYFDDKMDVLVDAFALAGSRVAAGVHDALAGAVSAADALERLTASYSQVAADSVDLIVVTGREGHALPTDERPRLSRRRREIRDAWVRVLREVRPDLSEGVARTVVAGVFPLMNQLAQSGTDSGECARLARFFLLAHGPQNK